MVYILLLIITVVFSLFDFTNVSPTFKRVLFFILATICFLLAGFRYITGGDYLSYVSYFIDAPNLGNFNLEKLISDTIEPGFLLILMFLKMITSNPQIVFITFSFIHIFLVFYIYKKHSKYLLVALALFVLNYYLLITMGQLRQGTAYLIGIIALFYAFEKNPLKFSIFVGLSLLFHTSTIALIPAYFICNSKFKKVQIVGILIASYILAYQVGIIEIIINTGMQLGVITRYIDYYSQFSRYTTNSIPIIGITYRLLNLAIMLFYRDRIFKGDLKFNFLVNMYFFGVIVFIGLGEISLLANRISRYFTIFETLIYPYILARVNNKNKLIIVLIILFLGSYFYLNTIFIENPDSFLPYRLY